MNSDNAVSFFSSPLSVHHRRRGSRRLLELSRAGSSLASPSCSWPSWMLLLLFLRHQNRPTLPLLFLFFLAAPPLVIFCSPAKLASTEQSQVNSFSLEPRLILAMLPNPFALLLPVSIAQALEFHRGWVAMVAEVTSPWSAICEAYPSLVSSVLSSLCLLDAHRVTGWLFHPLGTPTPSRHWSVPPWPSPSSAESSGASRLLLVGLSGRGELLSAQSSSSLNNFGP